MRESEVCGALKLDELWFKRRKIGEMVGCKVGRTLSQPRHLI
jgi:hypothetical protein